MKKFILKRLLLILPGVIAYIVTKYAQYNPEWTERVYSRSVYPALSYVVGILPSRVSFSVSEWLVMLFLFFCLGYITYYSHLLINGNGMRYMILYRGLVGVIAICSIIYFSFTALGVLNYHRYTFTYYTGYCLKEPTVYELEQLCTSLASELEEARENLEEDTNCHINKNDFDKFAQKSVLAMQMLAKQYPVLDKSRLIKPKPVRMSEVMAYADLMGVFFPLTMESNINVKAPVFLQPSTMVHELAHQCGFMREDEANFIAYLACKQINDPMFHYSGLFLAFKHSISALEEIAPEIAKEIKSNLSYNIKVDIAQNERYISEYEGIISKLSIIINDTHLKYNNQIDGVDSYGRMVGLLLAEQKAVDNQSDKNDKGYLK
ncbi:hypothetical protein ADH76_06695 [Enterocloster clostridioformis]|nr:DUF3810 domain-containing protein [Enterocloster clostridioformis]OXE71011.1 hypothetical protein ADH76_06695 [Enterocloster clostridioformis]QQR03874.1 DUF3810 domain-containing protein [Enterocloster clostridioformis]